MRALNSIPRHEIAFATETQLLISTFRVEKTERSVMSFDEKFVFLIEDIYQNDKQEASEQKSVPAELVPLSASSRVNFYLHRFVA